MPVPKHSASVQDSLRHRGYRQSSALLQQAQVLEGAGAQIQGRIHQNSIIPVWTRSDLNKDHLWPPLSVSFSAAGTNFCNEASVFALTLSLTSSYLPLFSFLQWNPDPSLVLALSPYSHSSLHLPLPLTAAAIHTGPPRNVPIPVAGQHYRTTEASNGILIERACDWSAFQWGGAAAVLYDHMSWYTLFFQINMSFKGFPGFVSVIMKDRKCGIIWLHQGHGSVK